MKLNKLMGILTFSKEVSQKIVNTITTKAKRGGQSFKEYIGDNENISHISLVVYDILPLPLKFALRYEKFDKLFVKNFSFIREKLLDYHVVEMDPKDSDSTEVKNPKISVKRVPIKRANKKEIAVKSTKPKTTKRTKNENK